MTPATKSPFLHAVEQALAAAGQIQGISQIMPAGLQRALGELQAQYDKLSNFAKCAYTSEDELNRLDWAVVRSALRQASTDVMSARGMQQEPSWMRPAIQIAEDRARPPVAAVPAPVATEFQVAFSATQMREREGAGFWNSQRGWVRLDEASQLAASVGEDSLLLGNLREGSGSADVKLLTSTQAIEQEEQYLDNTEGMAIARPM